MYGVILGRWNDGREIEKCFLYTISINFPNEKIKISRMTDSLSGAIIGVVMRQRGNRRLIAATQAAMENISMHQKVEAAFILHRDARTGGRSDGGPRYAQESESFLSSAEPCLRHLEAVKPTTWTSSCEEETEKRPRRSSPRPRPPSIPRMVVAPRRTNLLGAVSRG